ncbi:MAG: ATP-dependent DNA helicase RecG [Deltaproteobacteria bacterium]|nr:ATP-dependent DNA helicase RecG [Deltaproteobacteria bacterium]
MSDKTQILPNLLSSLLKPLVFASKDNFAHINTVRRLEGFIEALCKEAHGLIGEGETASPEPAASGAPLTRNGRKAGAGGREREVLSQRFLELRELFKGFDALMKEVKRERIMKALEIVESLKEYLPPVAAPPSIPLPEAESRACNDAANPPLPSLSEAVKNLKKLSTPLQYIKGIGPKFAKRLEKKGLKTVEDVLYFLPIRYEDRRHIKKIKELEAGKNEVSTGEIMAVGEVRYGRRKVFEAIVSDGASLLSLKWFNYKLPYMKKKYKTGERIIFYGMVSAFGHKKEVIHPDVEFIEPDPDSAGSVNFEGIVPVYSQVENLHQKTFRRLARKIADGYAPCAVGCAPERVMKRCGFMAVKDAFLCVHAPEKWDNPPGAPGPPSGKGGPILARRSLTFDELFSLEFGLALKRKAVKREGGLVMRGDGRLEKRLRALLPFTLTASQERVAAEIKKDMAEPHPMNRLIQGDVGSGKTIVSYMAVLNAVESGYQAAIMAPTELLAEQHFLTTHNYSERLGVKTALLTSALGAKEKKKTLNAIKEGEVVFVIGTHALIQKGVSFRNLGLAVIDEQHRFGVVQRAELKRKGAVSSVSPDILVMTATPIPRTLSMTVFGDLDVSIIAELPAGRKPVRTRLLREKDRLEAYGIIRDELKNGGQAYIVYPLVEESEELSLKDATNMKEHLRRDVFGDFSVGLLHGRMKAAEKESAMRDFKDGKIDILVSTTVIEVGVDAPNATVILIEHAERFGLAQLHQLRGRVGRGERRSICLLLAQWTASEDTWKRLRVLEDTTDGFKIAEEDLKIRGPGDFIGTRQSGLPEFRSAEALGDLNLLKEARAAALEFLTNDPLLSSPQAAVIKAVLRERWAGRLELAEIG